MITRERTTQSYGRGLARQSVSPRIRLLLADEVNVLRQGIRAMLDDRDCIEVVADTADGLKAVALAQKFQPSLVLSEIVLPSLNGIEVTRRIRKSVPQSKILIFTRLRETNYVRQCFSAGASGYLSKDATFEELIAAMEMVAQGEPYFSSCVSDGLLEDLASNQENTDGGDGLSRLTKREREILQLICEGKSNRGMADHLSISVKTVETHRGHLMKKLDLHHVTDLTKFAIHNGIIHLSAV